MVESNTNLPIPSWYSPIRELSKPSSLISPIRYDIFLHGNLAMQYLTFEQMEFENMKHMLSVDSLLTLFSGAFKISDLESQKLIEFIQSLSYKKSHVPSQDLGSITTKEIQTIIDHSYLGTLFDQQKLTNLLTQLITELRTHLNDKEVLKRLQSTVGSEDALRNFLDNEIAMKKFLSKKTSFYNPTIEDIMGVYLDQIYAIFSIHSSPPLTLRHQWHLIPPSYDVSNLVHTNIIEIILYSEIINNQLPKGVIKVSLLPNKKVQRFKHIELNLKLFYLEKIIRSYQISYHLSTGTISIKEASKVPTGSGIGSIKFKLNQGKIRRLSGTFKKNVILVNISEKKDNIDYEKLVLGAWHSNRVINSHEKEEGELEKEISHEHKHLEVSYHVYDNSKHYYLVQKKIKIGDDRIGITYTYKNQIPIPLGGTGYIQIKERMLKKEPTIFIPPMSSHSK